MSSVPTVLHVPATVHGRVLVDVPAVPPQAWLLGFHGYGETADEQLERLRETRAQEPWLLASVQALHPFYRRRDRAVVASWMTRVDRELAIEDNVDYVARVAQALIAAHGLAFLPCGMVGFSQGVAMAFRAAARLAPAAIVVTGADVPGELSAAGRALPPTLLTRGATDDAYSAAQWTKDAATLRELGGELELYEHAEGHDWPEELAREARRFLVARLG